MGSVEFSLLSQMVTRKEVESILKILDVHEDDDDDDEEEEEEVSNEDPKWLLLRLRGPVGCDKGCGEPPSLSPSPPFCPSSDI